MPLLHPSNLYAGDAVVLDTSGPEKYFIQRMQQHKAKSEALDQYYDKLHTSINPAGMRTQDLEGGFNSKVNDWRNFYTENKSAIKNPNADGGKAYNENMARYQDLLADTEKSKDAAKKEIIIAQHRLGGKMPDPTDSDLLASHGLSSSIYSKDHYKQDGITPYGLEDFSVSHPDFTPQLQQQFLKTAVGDLKAGYEEQDLKNAIVDKRLGKQSIPYTKRFSDEQIRQIGDRAGFLYDGSTSAKKFFEGQLLNPTEHQQLNDSFRKVYGKDIETPKEAAQAFAIHNNLAPKETGNKIMSWTDPNKSYNLKAIGFNNSKKLIDYRKAVGASADNDGEDPIENMMQTQESRARALPVSPYKTKEGQDIPMHNLPVVPDALGKVLARKDGAKTYYPDQVKIDENGDYYGVFLERYKDDKDPRKGQPIVENGKGVVDATLPPTRLSRDQVKAELGKEFLTKKENQRIMSKSAVKPATQETKPVKKTKADPLGLGL